MEINSKIEISKLEGDVESNESDCFIIDFSEGYLPIGFFDKLLCLLVGYSSLCFSDSITPVVANGSAYMSFDDRHFRIDEMLNQSIIIVSFANDCDAGLILNIVESLVEQLRVEMMQALPKCKIFVVWRGKGKKESLIDIEKVRNAVLKKKKAVHDQKGDFVELAEVCKAWFYKSMPTNHLENGLKEGEIIAFLSHMKVEAGAQARLLKNEGERYLMNHEGSFKGSRLFLDSDNLSDLRKLMDDVKKMKVMIVLLSKSYLTRPWCLVELYTAIKHNIPLVTVNIIGGGYDFDKGKEFLQSMTPETLDKANNGASKILQDIDIDVTEMGKVILSVLPNIIAQEFNANANTKIITTQVEVIIDKVIQEADKTKNGKKTKEQNGSGAPLSDREIKRKELIETRRYSVASIDTLSTVYEYEKLVERLKDELNRIESTIATISNEDKMFECCEVLLRIKNKVS